MIKDTELPLLPPNALKRSRMAQKGKSERSLVIADADKFFSLYIRTRGSDGYYNYCYTCSVRLTIGELQCGHFIRRGYLNTRWSELNCHPQCNTCNVDKHGNLKVYERRLRLEYGDGLIDDLISYSRLNIKIPTYAIREIAERYKGVVF